MIKADGDERSVRVKTDSRCDWTATTNVSWITLATTRGTGVADVRYTVAPNTGTIRVGTITIGGQTHRVEQDAARVTFTGRISNLSGACPDLRFAAGGRQVITNDDTHYSGGPCRKVENGIDVEVEGAAQSSGLVLAARIDLKPK